MPRTDLTALAGRARRAAWSRWRRYRDRNQPRGPLAPYAGLLPGRGRRVLVVVDAVRPERVREWTAAMPGVERHIVLIGSGAAPAAPGWHRIDDAAGLPELVVRLGVVDAIVDLRTEPAAPRIHVWQSAFLFLAHNGAYVVARANGAENLRITEREWLKTLVDEAQAGTPWLQLECLRSTNTVIARPSYLIFTKQYTHRAKLRPSDVPELLARRDPDVSTRELARIDAQTFESSVRVAEYWDDEPTDGPELAPSAAAGEARETSRPAMATHFDVPAMRVIHYGGDIVFAGQTLMYTEHSILPDSSRYPFAEFPSNPLLHEGPTRAARLHAAAAATERLPGTYYQLDPQWSGHFGHILTEVVSRLWGWEVAKAAYPDLKAILRRKPGSDARTELALLRAYGIADDDIVMIEKPVRLDSLVSATVMWQNFPPRHVHPQLREVWRRIAVNLADPAVAPIDRIFVSRSEKFDRRPCANRPAVEALFAEHGFTVIHPEEHDLATQAGLFRNASVVAGFGGSAMFNLMFTESLRTTIVLSHSFYWARNEHMYTSVLGGDAHYFWSKPHVLPPAGCAWSTAVSSSAWHFDFERHGRRLTELLDSLPARPPTTGRLD